MYVVLEPGSQTKSPAPANNCTNGVNSNGNGHPASEGPLSFEAQPGLPTTHTSVFRDALLKHN
jgi:hypothetical protein